MLFAPAPPNRAFAPVLVHDPLMLRAGTVADHGAWTRLREASRDHLIPWEESWTAEHLTLAAFRRRLKTYERDARRGGGLSLLAFRNADGALVGGVTLSNIRYGAARSGVLGYWIGGPFVRQGYGRAAVDAMVAHAFEAIDLNRLVAACQPENVASQKLLERCGFAREGLARDYLKINGVWRDHYIYALTVRDYRACHMS